MNRPPPEPVSSSQTGARIRALLAELADVLDERAAAEARPAQPEQVYSLPQAAKILGVSEASLRRMRDRGELRTIPVGRRRKVVSASELARITSGGD